MIKPSKQQRLAIVRDCITEYKISNQKQLEEILAMRGLIIPQATLSRYLTVLGVKKQSVEAGGCYYFPADASPKLADTLWQHVKGTITAVQDAANLVVIKTLPAAAQAVGAALDEINFPEIVGTLAGDDAIFVATPSSEAAQILKTKLVDLLKEMDR